MLPQSFFQGQTRPGANFVGKLAPVEKFRLIGKEEARPGGSNMKKRSEKVSNHIAWINLI